MWWIAVGVEGLAVARGGHTRAEPSEPRSVTKKPSRNVSLCTCEVFFVMDPAKHWGPFVYSEWQPFQGCAFCQEILASRGKRQTATWQGKKVGTHLHTYAAHRVKPTGPHTASWRNSGYTVLLRLSEKSKTGEKAQKVFVVTPIFVLHQIYEIKFYSFHL